MHLTVGHLAATFDATPDIVLVVHHVLPTVVPAAPSTSRRWSSGVRSGSRRLLKTFAASGAKVSGHVLVGESFAESLDRVRRAEVIRPDRGRGRARRDVRRPCHRLSGALLHCSPIPVALAPRGYAEDPPPTIAAVPTRPGDDNPLPFAITLASAAELPIRMLSLVSAENLAEAESVKELRQMQVAAAEENLAVAARAGTDAPVVVIPRDGGSCLTTRPAERINAC